MKHTANSMSRHQTERHGLRRTWPHLPKLNTAQNPIERRPWSRFQSLFTLDET